MIFTCIMKNCNWFYLKQGSLTRLSATDHLLPGLILVCWISLGKVKLGDHKEMAKSERNFHSKHRGGKNLNQQLGNAFTINIHCSFLTSIFESFPLRNPFLGKQCEVSYLLNAG